MYGYTGEDGIDYSYSEEFIIELIKKARNYGFDVNIKDNDSEDIPTCAVASEIYRGSVLKIIETLGPRYELPEDFLEKYKKYLNEARRGNNNRWYNRLNNELGAITDYVNKSKLNYDDLNLLAKDKMELLKSKTNDLDYDKLANLYGEIHALIEEIRGIISKIVMLNRDSSEYESFLSDSLNLIQTVLEEHLKEMEHKPNQKSLEAVKEIAICFAFASLIKKIEEKVRDYQEYLESLRKEAKNRKTLNECHLMLNEIAEIEIGDELKTIIEANIEKIEVAMTETRESFEALKSAKNAASSFIPISDIQEDVDYGNLTIEELKEITLSNQKMVSSYRKNIKDKISSLYEQLYCSVIPLIESGLMNKEDIKSIFSSTLSSSKVKEKKK